MPVIGKAALVVAAVVFAAVNATPANNAEQVVFSDTGALMNLVGMGRPLRRRLASGFGVRGLPRREAMAAIKTPMPVKGRCISTTSKQRQRASLAK
jgi:hypothetical protein